MIHVRLAEERDRPALHVMARAFVAEARPNLTYDASRANRTFDNHLRDIGVTFLVAEDADELTGFLVISRIEYAACAGFCLQQELFYVRPDKRGSRAAASMFAVLIQWAEETHAEEVYAGIATGHRSEAAARWLRRFGFESAGQHTMRRQMGGSTG